MRQVAAAIVALWVALPAFATTTGNLRGTVVDAAEGLPIPGVEVTIRSENLIGGAQTRTTTGNGEFAFGELPPGNYDLSAVRAGFSGITYANIPVQIGRTTTQLVEMPAAGSTEEVTVQGTRNVVDVENTTRGEVLTKEFLQRIPTGRSYQSAVQMVAGVGPGQGGNPNMAGAAYNENTYMLDGANITDPVTGTFSLNFNYDAIQQVEVMLGGYMPEYGVSLGGVVNLVTESGTNNLEFDSSAFYTNGNWRPKMDERWTADGFRLGPTGFDQNLQMLQVAGKLAGPIVRDRAWFILSYQHSRSLLQNTGILVPRDFDGHYVLGKVTVQPNAEHRISGFLQLDPSTIDNIVQNDIFVKPEAQGRQAQGGYATQGRWQWFLSPDASLDTQVVVQKSYIEVGAVPCTHDRSSNYHPCRTDEQQGDLDWETPGRVGISGAYDSVNFGYFTFDDRFRYQASTKLSILSIDDPLGGVHDVKIGLEGNQNVWGQIQGYSGNTLYYDLNAVPYDPTSFENYYWVEITGPIKFQTSMSQWSTFIQDAWKPIPNLTIKGGARFDHSVARNDLGVPVLVGNMWGPRLFAAWDPFGKQKTKISGGYGRFNDTGRLQVSDFTSVSSYGSKLFLGEFFNDGEGRGFSNGQDQIYDVSPLANYNVAHDKMRMPRTDEVTALLKQELVKDVAIGVNLTAKFTRHLFEPEEQNLIYDEDGSAVIGSRFGDIYFPKQRLRTSPLAMRDYYQGDVYVDKVFSNRWFGRVTYTNTQSVGTSNVSMSGSFLNDPQTQYNYGNLATDVRHVVKGYASWELPTDPWQQTVGAAFTYASGQPLERFYVADGFGSIRVRDRGIYTRFSPWWSLDLKFSQNLDVKKGKVVLDFMVQNVTNNQAPDNFDGVFYTQNRLFAVSRQDPLTMQLGLRYLF